MSGPVRLLVPTLETERLRLRPWSTSDVDRYARIIGSPGVSRHTGWGVRHHARRIATLLPEVARDEARRTIDRLADHWARLGYGVWAVDEKASGALIGQVGLEVQPDWVADPANIEIGWLLARSAWGNGFATESARASLDYAFGPLGLERVVSITRPANRRSERVMQRLGLSFEGRTTWNGREVLWYAIDRAAWERLHAASATPGLGDGLRDGL